MDKRKTKVAPKGMSVSEKIKKYGDKAFPEGDQQPAGKDAMKKKPAKKMAMGGKAKAYAKGGKVRGCGMAKKGVKKAKMY